MAAHSRHPDKAVAFVNHILLDVVRQTIPVATGRPGGILRPWQPPAIGQVTLGRNIQDFIIIFVLTPTNPSAYMSSAVARGGPQPLHLLERRGGVEPVDHHRRGGLPARLEDRDRHHTYVTPAWGEGKGWTWRLSVFGRGRKMAMVDRCHDVYPFTPGQC